MMDIFVFLMDMFGRNLQSCSRTPHSQNGVRLLFNFAPVFKVEGRKVSLKNVNFKGSVERKRTPHLNANNRCRGVYH